MLYLDNVNLQFINKMHIAHGLVWWAQKFFVIIILVITLCSDVVITLCSDVIVPMW
jgi:hypothetical protein